MKKLIFLILIVCCFGHIYSQNKFQKNIRKNIESNFVVQQNQNIDISKFDGMRDTVKINYSIYKQVYLQIFKSQVSTKLLPSVDSFKHIVGNYTRRNTVPISLMKLIYYDQIKDSALLQRNLLIASSPYKLVSQNIKFVLPKKLTFNNSPYANISNFVIKKKYEC